MGSQHLLESLRAAVTAAPDDVELRLHLAELLVEAGEREEAVREAAQVLVLDPQNVRALRLVSGRREVAQPEPDQPPANDSDEILRGLEQQLSDIRQSQASSVPSARKRSRSPRARANASCTASRAASGSPRTA
jgi:predicted Zn-dependent protease